MSGPPRIPTADEKQFQRTVTEARARITWGDSRSEVHQWLCAQGLFPELADDILQQLMSERSQSMRRKGLRDLLIGAAAGVVGGALSLGLFKLAVHVPHGGRVLASLGIMCLLPAGYGVYLVVRGLERLVLGARADGADTDIGDFW